jgi:peptidoglycan/xylan/chitin deacetylase (PgdA/CDA1 family)
MNKELVLMFHDVVNHTFPHSGFNKPGALQYTIDDKKFEKLVKYCVESSVDVVFTFDDGGSSFYNVIAPILEKYGQHGVFFISTGYIGTDRFLTREQIKALHARGHVIASHSNSHPRDISKLSYDEIVEEWSKSKSILEDIIEEDVKQASIPGGAISTNVLRGLKHSGYDVVYTSIPTTKAASFDGMDVIGRYTITNHSDLKYINKLLHNLPYRKKLIVKYKFLRLLKSILGSNYNTVKQAILAHK